MSCRYLQFVVLTIAALTIGCQSQSDLPTSQPVAPVSNGADSPVLDFDSLLKAINGAMGKPFQSMQMDAMQSASYKYEGSIQVVADIVGPIVERAGFSESADNMADKAGAEGKEMQEKMGIDIKPIEQKMWTHPNGDTVMVARMDMSSKDVSMKMLTVHMMNPKKMADFGAALNKP